MKFYAVLKGKKGEKPSIYSSWNECKSHVIGVKGSVYKSFPTREEAELYLKNATDSKRLDEENVLYAFVDGSFNEKLNVSGYGVAFIYNDEVICEMKKRLDEEEFLKHRNIYGEIEGTKDAIRTAFKNGCKEINIVYDYSGIENWALGLHDTNNKLGEDYVKFINKAKENIKINFIKVKSHAKEEDGGHKYNDLADKLSKEAVGIL